MKNTLRPCHVIEIVTPKKFVLNGLWFGPAKPKRVIIFIHGLTASLFSMRDVVDALTDSKTAVVTFNNRGFEQVSEVKRIIGEERKWIKAGAGHEKFTDCIDDIQGAIDFVRKAGVKEIYLAGHSTGSQKACYWAAKNGRGVKGIILLGPLSDYAILVSQDKAGSLRRAVARAKRLVQSGKSHAFMPEGSGLWFTCDAQRFLSLSTPDSPEEIFTYAQPNKIPRLLRSIRIPILVLLAGAEEHGKESPRELASWFRGKLRGPHTVSIVPKVGHGFKGGEKTIARAVGDFIKTALH